jgi:hypothetical protein
MRVEFGITHVVAGIIGLALAWLVLRPPLSRAELAGRWPQLMAAGAAIAVLCPVLVVLYDHTMFFVARGMREVGAPAFEEPPVSEQAAVAVRAVMQPGETWAFTTPEGRCPTWDRAYYWLAFRYVPHQPDCEQPDVELFWKHPAPPGASVVRSGPEYEVVRW